MHPAFTAWLAQVPAGTCFLEPFAGAGDIPRLMTAAGAPRHFDLYDIAPASPLVTQRDTLDSFPSGYLACVTNPPYLSLHVARRRAIATNAAVYGSFQSLYQVALDRCLAHCGYVAAIVPESFLTTGMFRERCSDVVRLGPGMFNDTEIPTCLALFTPNPPPALLIWDRSNQLGTYEELASTPWNCTCAARITFNAVDGQLGLRAVDTAATADLGFCLPSHIPADRVNTSSRLITRVRIDNLSVDPAALVEQANDELARWRATTADVLLTAFTSHRRDGQARRRLDYANARTLLAKALCVAENKAHHTSRTLQQN